MPLGIKQNTRQLLGSGGVFNPININLYVYVYQNPIYYVDPTGKWGTQSRILGRYQPVHQQAIQRVLGNMLTEYQLQIMYRAQIEIDRMQGNAEQFMHAMTGAGLDRVQVIRQANEFVIGRIRSAQEANKRGDIQAAYTDLSFAMHTVQDATSPSHIGFQVWDDNAPNIQKLAHVEAERVYPGEGTPERAQLEGVTQWVYDIFRGTTAMPQNIFDPQSGQLLLPAQYLNQQQGQHQQGQQRQNNPQLCEQ